MLIFVILLLIFSISGIKFADENSFYDDYLSLNNTTIINGIFVLLVFLSHSSQYISLGTGIFDNAYASFQSYLSQMVVVPFLFFSGYGTMESIRHKDQYVNQIPKYKFLKTLVHFDIAIVVFLILQFLFGNVYDIGHILLSFIGFTSVGNSNWYIFAMLFLYVAVFVAYKISGSTNELHQLIGSFLVFGFVVLYMIVMIATEMPSRFYNTILLFPIGMLFALTKDQIHKFVMRSDICYVSICIIMFGIYYIAYHMKDHIVFYLLWGISFMGLILLLMMKVKVGNTCFLWLGKNIFGIYVLQRIPMMILNNLAGGEINREYPFVIISFLVTVLLTLLFNLLLKKVDKVLKLQLDERNGR